MDWFSLVSTLHHQTRAFGLKDFFTLSKGLHVQQDPSLLWKSLEPGPLRDFLKQTPSWWKRGEKFLHDARDSRIHILHPSHPDYPQIFLKHSRPPVFLTYLGTPCWQSQKLISIVGSRDPSSWSIRWLEEHLSNFLQLSQWSVLSGAARGIDQTAHAISLRAQRPTLAILPAGLARPYPSNFIKWFDLIFQTGGAIMSEYPPLFGMKKYHFVHRNRLIAWLGEFLFVVEAQRASGSLLTARLATEVGKELCVLPGYPNDCRCAGTVDLLFDGVHPLRDSQDLLLLANQF